MGSECGVVCVSVRGVGGVPGVGVDNGDVDSMGVVGVGSMGAVGMGGVGLDALVCV